MTPVLETERLRLRAHRADDLQPSLAMWSDPHVTRYIRGGASATVQKTWMGLLAYRGLWSLVGYGYWAVEERASGTFVGDVGFADFKRDVAASARGVPELGWAFVSAVHGKGYGAEAAGAALAWADAHLESPRTVALIDEDNRASVRVGERCGYALLERTTLNDRPTLVFERRRRVT